MIRSSTAARPGGPWASTPAGDTPSRPFVHSGWRRYAAPVCALMLLAGALLPAGPAAAAKAAGTEKAAKPAKTGKAAKSKAVKIKTLGDSSESRSERIARLRRECRGGVNAGACEGYTH